MKLCGKFSMVFHVDPRGVPGRILFHGLLSKSSRVLHSFLYSVYIDVSGVTPPKDGLVKINFKDIHLVSSMTNCKKGMNKKV